MKTTDRFWKKVEITDPDDCWEWTAAQNGKGYGFFVVKPKKPNTVSTTAHRFAYKLCVGPIADNLQVDHLCQNKSCVNPDHLEAVTPWENQRRIPNSRVARSVRETCVHGHPRTPENIYVAPDGRKSCRICRRSDYRRYHEKKRQPSLA